MTDEEAKKGKEKLRAEISAALDDGFRALENAEYDAAITIFTVRVLARLAEQGLNLDESFAANAGSEAHRGRGTAYAEKGDYDTAIADYDEAIKLNPKDAAAFNNRGNAYGKKSDYDRAIADHDEAVKLNPKDDTAYYNRGVAYDSKGDYDRAIADYDEAIKLNPKDAAAYYNRGNAYGKKGDYDRAIADHDEAVKLKPQDAAAYYNRGNAYGKKGDYDRAIADYDEAIKLNPKHAAAFNNRGNAYANKGDYGTAIADYSKAIDLNPKNAAAYYNRGIAYGKKGDYDRAIADYSKAIELNPKYAIAYNNRGTAYANKGDHDTAIADYSKAIDLNPKNAAAYDNRGIAYANKGEYGNAMVDFNKTGKIEPHRRRRIHIYAAFIAQEASEKNRGEILKKVFLLQEKINAIKDALFIKETVFHYTDLSALKELGGGGRFRFYNAAYMNDPEEGSVFFDLLKNGGKLRDTLYPREKYAPPTAYIGSFVKETKANSDDGNLHLWHAYGRDNNEEAKGCRLRFSPGIFADSISIVLHHSFIGIRSAVVKADGLEKDISRADTEQKADDSENYPLQKIFYVDTNNVVKNKQMKLQVKAVEKEVQNFYEFYENNGNKKVQEIVLHLMRILLDDVRFLFKRFHYKSEQEARVIVFRPFPEKEGGDTDIKVDMSQDSGIPTKLYLDASDKFRCNEVTFGPKADNYEEWKFWLKQKAKNRIQSVNKSKINIR